MRIDALYHDPHCQWSHPLVEVAEKGASLQTIEEQQQAATYFRTQNCLPQEWQNYVATGKAAPHNFRETSFIHHFNLTKHQTSGGLAIITDIYRPPWKPYYTSDVFLHQWLLANQFPQTHSRTVEPNMLTLPSAFPKTLYINNVTHAVTVRQIRQLLSTQRSACFKMPCQGKAWDSLRATPHLRYVYRILETYNYINQMRAQPTIQTRAVQIYGQTGTYHLKFTVG